MALLTSLEWHVAITLGGVLLTLLFPPLWTWPVLTFAASLLVALVLSPWSDLARDLPAGELLEVE